MASEIAWWTGRGFTVAAAGFAVLACAILAVVASAQHPTVSTAEHATGSSSAPSVCLPRECSRFGRLTFSELYRLGAAALVEEARILAIFRAATVTGHPAALVVHGG